MLKINRNKAQWQLYENATEEDAEALNEAANKAVLEILTAMQSDEVCIRDAFKNALSEARKKFFELSDLGAYDTDTLWVLNYEIRRQFDLDD